MIPAREEYTALRKAWADRVEADRRLRSELAPGELDRVECAPPVGWLVKAVAFTLGAALGWLVACFSA